MKRLTKSEEVVLLHTANSIMPFTAVHGEKHARWLQVANDVSKSLGCGAGVISERLCRDVAHRLLKSFQDKVRDSSMGKPFDPELGDEPDRLCAEIQSKIDCFRGPFFHSIPAKNNSGMESSFHNAAAFSPSTNRLAEGASGLSCQQNSNFTSSAVPYGSSYPIYPYNSHTNTKTMCSTTHSSPAPYTHVEYHQHRARQYQSSSVPEHNSSTTAYFPTIPYSDRNSLTINCSEGSDVHRPSPFIGKFAQTSHSPLGDYRVRVRSEENRTSDSFDEEPAFKKRKSFDETLHVDMHQTRHNRWTPPDSVSKATNINHIPSNDGNITSRPQYYNQHYSLHSNAQTLENYQYDPSLYHHRTATSQSQIPNFTDRSSNYTSVPPVDFRLERQFPQSNLHAHSSTTCTSHSAYDTNLPPIVNNSNSAMPNCKSNISLSPPKGFTDSPISTPFYTTATSLGVTTESVPITTASADALSGTEAAVVSKEIEFTAHSNSSDTVSNKSFINSTDISLTASSTNGIGPSTALAISSATNTMLQLTTADSPVSSKTTPDLPFSCGDFSDESVSSDAALANLIRLMTTVINRQNEQILSMQKTLNHKFSNRDEVASIIFKGFEQHPEIRSNLKLDALKKDHSIIPAIKQMIAEYNHLPKLPDLNDMHLPPHQRAGTYP
ncbi:hypothetical protein BATDEDRAFT_26795 [Batrachochytrium dendrobatidis JAM81]|uniref:Uncharacterized protein n=2 Tax=Batrachochytrium dendrobatidis TaxID=109871 RepID=F4P900_BATDJ|nr:uncharacterized protein BATDEDRAFT_26795 [Batrachochytrium dendrobatidis JAM81]EGF78258.1 hypothetical protein BATDEDRAFT_26795 [Batrachochytrium dendrobatidis JAM81]OAJ44284.1 hypothetical protein BDEG_27534 [Batrachochytrium dendrobatidis JEL423]|eukprot:XP_006681053.1 hypothetical protein BATDEDRAFT_26795 [Batrachochytrium dendrobatidis JAM81]